jgi:AcrR family transcriptional regulator
MTNKLTTIDKIINASTTLFYSNTYAATTLQDIVKESDISIGSIYHAFKNGKQDIADYIVNKYYSEFKSSLGNVLQTDLVNTPIETIVENLIQTLITIGEQYPCYYDPTFAATQNGYKEQEASLKSDVIGYTTLMLQIKKPNLTRSECEFKARISYVLWEGLLSEYEKTEDKAILKELKKIAINYLN